MAIPRGIAWLGWHRQFSGWRYTVVGEAEQREQEKEWEPETLKSGSQGVCRSRRSSARVGDGRERWACSSEEGTVPGEWRGNYGGSRTHI